MTKIINIYQQVRVTIASAKKGITFTRLLGMCMLICALCNPQSAGAQTVGYSIYLSDGKGHIGAAINHAIDVGSWRVGDFNADGISDFVRYVNAALDIYTTDGTGQVMSWDHLGVEADNNWKVADFNGDGRADIIRHLSDAQGFDIYLTNGTGYPPSMNIGLDADNNWKVADFNGDGRADIIRHLSDAQGFDIYLTDGTNHPPAVNLGLDGGNWNVGDFNGDGNADIIRYVGHYFDVFLTDGTGHILSSQRNDMDEGEWQLSDVNNDKKTDLIRYAQGAFDIYLSDGTGRFSWLIDKQHYVMDSGSWKLGDFDGDGFNDIIRYVEGRYFDVYFSDGAGGIRPSSERSELLVGLGDWQLGDFNGDRVTDLIVSGPTVTQIEQLSLLRDYFGEIGDLQRADPPSFKNAASGYFRDAVITSGYSDKLAHLRTFLSDAKFSAPGTQKIQSLFVALDGIVSAFTPENYKAHWTTSSTLTTQAIGDFFNAASQKFGQYIVGGVQMIGGYFSGNAVAIEAGAQRIGKAAQATINSLKGYTYQDTHANGNISLGVESAANATRKRIQANFGGDFSGYEGEVAKVFDVISTMLLSDLSTAKHDPWLRADWQIMFGTIVDLSNVMLAELLGPRDQLSFLSAYFGRISELAALNPPSAPNAANGYFHDRMISDARLTQLRTALRSNQYTPAGATRIRTLFTIFDDQVQSTFANPDNANVTAHWYNNSQVLVTNFDEAKGYIHQLFTNQLGDLLKLSPPDFNKVRQLLADGQVSWSELQSALPPAVWDAIKDGKIDPSDFQHFGEQVVNRLQFTEDQIANLLDMIANLSSASDGTHANGYLSVGVRTAAQTTLSRIATDFGANFTGYEGEVAMRIKAICEQLVELPTEGHNPWLRADWQIRFGLISSQGELSLNGLQSYVD